MKIDYKKTILISLVILGIFFRIYKWAKFEMFSGDEGIQLIYAEDILSGNYFPITGEISSLDQENKFILHNSPIGIYFQALLYLIGFRSEILYSLTYTFINLAIIILIYKSVLLLTSQKSATVALVLLLFSPFMLNASVWTSQPVNSLFFESIAIYLIVKFLKTNNENLFLWGSISSIIATQMYPPMYLLIIPKFIIWLYLVRNKILNQTKFLLGMTVAVIIIYLPFLFMELKYDFINTRSFLEFSRDSRVTYPNTVSYNSVTYLEKIAHLNKKVVNFFSHSFKGNEIVIAIYFLLISVGSLYKSTIKEKKLLTILSILTFFPIITMYMLYSKPSISGERAYLDIIFPFLVIFIAIIHNKTSQKIVFMFLLIYLLVTILPMKDYFFYKNAKKTSLNTINKTIDYVHSNTKQKNLTVPFIHVISEVDTWGWDGSIYWYILEKKMEKNIVSIDFLSSKADTNHQYDLRPYIYLICHGYDEQNCLSDWETIEKSYVYGKKNFFFMEKEKIDNNIVFTIKID